MPIPIPEKYLRENYVTFVGRTEAATRGSDVERCPGYPTNRGRFNLALRARDARIADPQHGDVISPDQARLVL